MSEYISGAFLNIGVLALSAATIYYRASLLRFWMWLHVVFRYILALPLAVMLSSLFYLSLIVFWSGVPERYAGGLIQDFLFLLILECAKFFIISFCIALLWPGNKRRMVIVYVALVIISHLCLAGLIIASGEYADWGFRDWLYYGVIRLLVPVGAVIFCYLNVDEIVDASEEMLRNALPRKLAGKT